MKLIYIACFGLLGVFCRYIMGIFISKIIPYPFPWGTFFINLLGAFLIGIIYVLGVERNMLSSDLRVGITIGLLGGFTTFSSYSLEAVTLFESGQHFYSFIYLSMSTILGFLSTLSGMTLARKLGDLQF